MTAAFPHTLVFPHLAKTGGTSINYHFRTHLPEGSLFVKGPHNRAHRLRAGLPQLESLPADDFENIKVIQGHGTDQSVLRMVPEDRLRLMVVLRHPVARYQSHYDHFDVALKRRGLSGREDRPFHSRVRPNPLAEKIVKMFPALAGDADAPLRDRAFNVLRGFEYVVVTETMSAQIKPLLAQMGIADTLEKRRVTKAKDRATPDLSEGEIIERNPVDMELFEVFSKGEMDSDGYINPLGFDAAPRRAAIAAMKADVDSIETARTTAYTELVRGLAGMMVLPGAKDWLETDAGRASVDDPDLLLSMVAKKWKDSQKGLTPEQIELVQTKSKKWYSGARAIARRRAKGVDAK